MSSFFELSTPRFVSPGRYVFDVPDKWQQGRGAFGGLVLSALSRAVDAHVGAPDRSIRTLTGELCGPVLPGEAEVLVETLRLGSGTTTVAARLVQGGEVQTHVVAVLGKTRPVDVRYDGLPRPAMRPWRECAPVESGMMAPSFAWFFEYRDTSPAQLGTGAAPASEALTCGWVRPLDPGAVRDAAYLVGVADAWWPALLMTMAEPRPMATITFTIDIVGSFEGLDPDAPLFHEGRTLVSRGGFAPELRTLWGEDGRLLAINHQTFVVIK